MKVPSLPSPVGLTVTVSPEFETDSVKDSVAVLVDESVDVRVSEDDSVSVVVSVALVVSPDFDSVSLPSVPVTVSVCVGLSDTEDVIVSLMTPLDSDTVSDFDSESENVSLPLSESDSVSVAFASILALMVTTKSARKSRILASEIIVVGFVGNGILGWKQ